MSDLLGRFATIGVIDSGWKSDIADPRIMAGVSFMRTQPELGHAALNDENGHGTTCTRQILRIASHSWVYPLRVFGSRLETSPHRLLRALQCASSLDLDVVNLSLSTHDERARGALYQACHRLAKQGSIVVASQTNGVGGGYPAAFDNVISVGQAGTSGGEPDIVVHAAGAMGAFRRQSTRLSTSLAAAIVSGHAALAVRKHGRMDIDAMRRLLAHEFARMPERSA